MKIQTERLTLASLSMEHLQSAYACSSDPVNTRYMMFLPVDSIEETRKFIEDCEAELQKQTPGYYEFAVLREGVYIGSVNLYFDTAPDIGELGWLFLPEYQGRGYATEAARALMDWGYHRLGIRHFIAHCDAGNEPSQAVMRRLGMICTDDTHTRKNRGSDELRRELLFEVWV
jgi:RimJ/RimL family protein N-acetyltransferase